MNREQVIGRLNRFEGRIPYMYRCTGGEITIGVGHAIRTAEEACALAWDKPGTAAADFERVAGADIGKRADAYASLSSCRLPEEEITWLCGEDIDRFEAQLKREFPEWDSYPDVVQEALFDMAFNLGLGGLRKFPNLLAAVRRGDWIAAAAESQRKGIPESRNQEIERLFLSA